MTGKKNIVWIASYPKSGNTWFRAFLSNIVSGSDQPQNINKLDIINIASSRILFDQITGIHASDLSIAEIEKYRPMVYRQISNESFETTYMKVHDAWTLNPEGEPLFPEDATQCVIYIIRHPMDVAVSLSFHNTQEVKHVIQFMNDDTYGLCLRPDKLYNQLPQKLLNWSNHVESWVIRSSLKVHVMRYEDMIDHPHQTFSKALHFLDIAFTKEHLNKAITNSSFEVLHQQENKYGFHEKPIRAKSFFRKGEKSDWMNHIDQETGRSFINKNSRILELFYISNMNT